MRRLLNPRLLPPLLGLVIFVLCAWAFYQELRRYSLQEVQRSIAAIPTPNMLGAIALVLCSYIVLTGYDTLAVRFARCRLSYRRTALAAGLTYAISRSAGVSALSGSAIRYRFYRRWGLPNLAIAQIIAFCTLSFWVGLFAVGGMVLTLRPPLLPAGLSTVLPANLPQTAGLLGIAATLAYFLWSALSSKGLTLGRWVVPRLPLSLAVAQLGLTALDWALAAAILHRLLPGAPYILVFSALLLAQVAGVFSSVPGGLGVFETVVLLTLSPPLPKDQLLAALLVYRAIYFLLPLALALITLLLYELRHRKPNAGEMEPPPEVRYGE